MLPQLIFEVKLRGKVACGIQRKIGAPAWVLRHQLTDFIHAVLPNGSFNDDLIVDGTDDFKPCLFQSPHGFCQNVTGDCLGTVAYDTQFSAGGVVYTKSVPRTAIPDVIHLFFTSGVTHRNSVGQL